MLMTKTMVSMVLLLAVVSCTHKVQIEPSDKPFVVNLNVKVDHEVKMKIQDDNADLLNLEEAASRNSKTRGKSKASRGGK